MNLLAATPSNWTRATIGSFCDVQLGKMLQNNPSSERDELKPYLRAINVAKGGLDLSHEFSMWIRPQEADRFRLAKGDVLVSEGGDAGRAAIFDADGEYYFQNAINRVRPDNRGKIEPDFIYYWFTFLKITGYVEMICNVATIPHFTAEKVKAAPLALPLLDTQRRIVWFLHGKTAQIDGLIEKKRALLDTLAEKRQALITRAVTKGLNPDAPMKPSGIDWLGDIPAHWEVLPLKRTLQYQEGPGILAADFRDEGLPLLRVASIGGRFATLDGVNYLDPEMAHEKWGHFLTKPGDLLISASATSGIVSEVTETTSGCVPYTGIIRINPIEGMATPVFGRHFLVSGVFLSQIDQLKAGSTIQHFGPHHLGLMVIVAPPLGEQRAIGLHLDQTLDNIKQIEACVSSSIQRLTEYRSAIVTAAVTGQITELR